MVTSARNSIALLILLLLPVAGFAVNPIYLWHLMAIQSANNVAVSTNGSLVAVNTANKALFYDATGKYLRFVPSTSGVYRSSFSTDSQYFVTAARLTPSANYSAQIWRTDGTGLFKSVGGMGSYPTDVYVIPGTQLFLMGRDSDTVISNFNGGSVTTFSGRATRFGGSANGGFIGLGTNNVAKVYSYPSVQLKGTFDCGSAIQQVFVRNQGDLVYTISYDQVLRIWSLQTQQLRALISGCVSAALTPDQQRVTVLTNSGTMFTTLDAVTGNQLFQVGVPPAIDAYVSPNLAYIYASHGVGKHFTRHDYATGFTYSSPEQLNGSATFFKFSSDQTKALLTADGRVVKLDLATGAINSQSPHLFDIKDVSSDGALALCLSGNEYFIVRTDTGQTLRTIPKVESGDGSKDAGAFSYDGSRVFFAGTLIGQFGQASGRVWMYDTATGGRLASGGGEVGQRYVGIPYVGPDNKIIVSEGSGSNHAYISLSPYKRHWANYNDYGTFLRVSESLRRVAVFEGTIIKVIDLDTGKLVVEKNVGYGNTPTDISNDFSTVVVRAALDTGLIALRFVSLEDGTVLHEINEGLATMTAKFQPDETRVLCDWGSDFVSSIVNPGTTIADVAPDALAVKLGRITFGSVAELRDRDSICLFTQKWFMPDAKGPSVVLEVEGTSPFATLSQLSAKCVVETDIAGVFEHKTELWNYQTGGWDAIDFKAGSVSTSFVTFTVVGTGDVNRFLQPLTNRLKARLSLRLTGQSAAFSWSTVHDQFNWHLNK